MAACAQVSVTPRASEVKIRRDPQHILGDRPPVPLRQATNHCADILPRLQPRLHPGEALPLQLPLAGAAVLFWAGYRIYQITQSQPAAA